MNSLAKQIGEVPKTYARGDKSTACILKEAGFPAGRHLLSVDEMESVLDDDPELAHLWLERSRDQRVAGGWGIEHVADSWRIRSFSGAGSFTIRDRKRALAEFIVRYVRFIGDVLERVH